jgi:hypothetical protein
MQSDVYYCSKFQSMESENFIDQSLLGRLEHVSSAASGCELSFRKVIESGTEAEEILLSSVYRAFRLSSFPVLQN